MVIHAYAKLNLALSITGKLSNGYHALDMVMQTISLHDTLEIQKADGIHILCKDVQGDTTQNTAYKASKLFFEHTSIAGGATVEIQKNIPAQAGLGGGSSDGTAVLCALNHLYHANLPTKTLAMLALKIGADAPFFIDGGCARAQGVGELLSPLENQCDFTYLLIKPRMGVNTTQAYYEYANLEKTKLNMNCVCNALAAGNASSYYQNTGNALYPAAKKLCPEVDLLIQSCYNSGAEFAMMTGSGSCVFALYKEKTALMAAFEQFQAIYPFVCIAKGVPHGSSML